VNDITREEFLERLKTVSVKEISFTYSYTRVILKIPSLNTPVLSLYKSEFKNRCDTIRSVTLNLTGVPRHPDGTVIEASELVRFPGVGAEYRRLVSEFEVKMKDTSGARKKINDEFKENLRIELEGIMDRYMKDKPNVTVSLDEIMDIATFAVSSSHSRYILKSLLLVQNLIRIYIFYIILQ
jgi:hypothetical protein